jgi:short-subunit dehydrogenase
MATALITGASSGLGEVFAHQLARKGYDLVLTARREGRLANVAAKAKEMGAKQVNIIASDLGRRDAPAALIRELETRGLQIDYLVNNAGFGTSGRFDRLPVEREIEEIDLNITALVALTRLLLPAMVERRSGTIINVASTAAFQAVPYMSTYAATKAFVLSFTEGIAGEFSGTGVKILALCPGPVKTDSRASQRTKMARCPHSLIWTRKRWSRRGLRRRRTDAWCISLES